MINQLNGLALASEPSHRNHDSIDSEVEEDTGRARDMDLDNQSMDLAAEKIRQGMNCALGAEFAQAVVFYTAALRSIRLIPAFMLCAAMPTAFYANTTRLWPISTLRFIWTRRNRQLTSVGDLSIARWATSAQLSPTAAKCSGSIRTTALPT